MQEVFSQVDFVALPTMPVSPPDRCNSTARVGDVDTVLLEAMIRYTALFDQSGHPALAMPWRQPGHRDVASLQLIGPLHSDHRLLALAESLERRIDGLGNAAVA
jgi:Asp-tRNA(Asn)/Glu-tRNA(Gln) amidotransferase A subunit family amidase